MVHWNWFGPVSCKEQAEADAVHGGPTDIHYGYLYRFENDGERVQLYAFSIKKLTPRGWVIRTRGFSNTRDWRFVSRHTRKQFALPSLREAAASFIARKERQASIYEAKAQLARDLIHEMKGVSF